MIPIRLKIALKNAFGVAHTEADAEASERNYDFNMATAELSPRERRAARASRNLHGRKPIEPTGE